MLNMNEQNPDWHKNTLRLRGAPQWICDDCGRRYGEWYKGKQYIGPTCYFMFQRLGNCDICEGEELVVAEPRDYGHLCANWDMVKLKYLNDLKNV
jgi:hypothetical protein